MTEEQYAAHEAIRQLTGQFADAANRTDLDLFRSLWTVDCVWEFKAPMAMRTEGVDATVDKLRSLMEPWEFFAHLVYQGVLTVQGQRASARWYVTELARSRDGKTSYRNVGLYQDELVQQAEGWRFASRVYHYIWLDQDAFGGRGVPLDPALVPHALIDAGGGNRL